MTDATANSTSILRLVNKTSIRIKANPTIR